MNREIKFRGYSEELKHFVYGFFQEVEVEGIGYSYIFWQGNTTPVRADSVAQFTGIHDKNGKEIYEGDIISIEYGKGIVEYSEKQAMFIINWIGDNEAYNESLAYNPRNYICGKTRKDIEVIGNIYENPEFTQSSE